MNHSNMKKPGNMLHTSVLIMRQTPTPCKVRFAYLTWRPKFFRAVLQMALIILAYMSTVTTAEAEDCDNYSGDHIRQVQCISSRIQNLDSELNEVYKQALGMLPEKETQDERKEKEQLRKSQRAWLKFKDENCALIGGLQGGNNLWVTHFAALCEEQQLKERIQFLKDIADGIDRL